MLPTVVGAKLLQEKALAQGATAVVMDTTGLVAPAAFGGALKDWKIAMLRPKTIIAFQRGGELEYILAPLRRESELALHIFPVCDAVRPKSPEERASRRRKRFIDYFSTAQFEKIKLMDLPVYGLDRVCPGRLDAAVGPFLDHPTSVWNPNRSVGRNRGTAPYIHV